MDSCQREQKDGKIVDNICLRPAFRFVSADRALGDRSVLLLLGLDKDDHPVVLEHLDFTGLDVLFPGCHIYAHARSQKCVGPVDTTIISQLFHELRLKIEHQDYPAKDMPGDIKISFLALATLFRQLGIHDLDNDMSYLGDRFSQEFKDCLENA